MAKFQTNKGMRESFFIGFTASDGSMTPVSKARGYYDNYDEAWADMKKVQPQYKHRLEVFALKNMLASDGKSEPSKYIQMPTNEDLINHLKKQNEDIQRKLSVMVLERCNNVVVSTDFGYYVNVDNGFASVGILCNVDEAVRFTQSEAERLAKTFHACNGNGKITWVAMPTRQYLTRLMEKNNETIEIINKYRKG